MLLVGPCVHAACLPGRLLLKAETLPSAKPTPPLPGDELYALNMQWSNSNSCYLHATQSQRVCKNCLQVSTAGLTSASMTDAPDAGTPSAQTPEVARCSADAKVRTYCALPVYCSKPVLAGCSSILTHLTQLVHGHLHYTLLLFAYTANIYSKQSVQ